MPPISINFNLPFNEAIAQMAARGVVLPDVYYGQLQGIHKQLAFSIANVAKTDQLQAVLDSLTAHLKNGGTFASWQKHVDVQSLGLPRHRLDNIFRTNIQQAYNHGHWQQALANKSTHGYLMYDAINDSRTRPTHKANDGIIRKIEDPIWKRIWFSRNVYRCRCRLISLTEQQAVDRSGDGKGIYKTATEDPLRDKAWDSVDVMNADFLQVGIDNALAKRLTSTKIEPLLKNKAKTMLEAWAGTNIAKRIPVNDISGIKSVLDEYARIFPEHLPHGVKALLTASKTDDFFMATDGKGVFKIAAVEYKGFDSHRDLLGAFAGIKNNQLLTQNHEYALETLWHEICHNRQTGGDALKKLNLSDPRRQLMEAVNQLVSRLSYSGFIERLGGKATHQEWVMENGYGYYGSVKRIRELFSELGISESIKGDLFNINFNGDLIDIQELLTNAITRKVVIDDNIIRRLLVFSVTNPYRFNQLLMALKHPT